MKTILYVDDNEADRFAISEFFNNSGISIKCASSATEAYKELENAEYDLIICDMMMPVNDGLKFAKQISAMGIETPLMLTSGIPDLMSFNEYKGLNNYLGFILKPITPENIKRFLI